MNLLAAFRYHNRHWRFSRYDMCIILSAAAANWLIPKLLSKIAPGIDKQIRELIGVITGLLIVLLGGFHFLL